jgi:hypothetical protein
MKRTGVADYFTTVYDASEIKVIEIINLTIPTSSSDFHD